MHLIPRHQISSLLALFLVFPCLAFGQLNMPNYDVKRPYHFGITLGYNASDFKIVHSNAFPHNDSILVAESTKGQGFNLGIISDLHLQDHWNLRFIPTLSFAEKKLNYTMIDRSIVNKNIESVYIDFPLLVKFKSDRIENFRMYLLGGVKYSIDMASNADARNAPDIVKITRTDISADYGFGFDFYFPMFKFSPELRVSHGMFSVLKQDEALVYANVLDKLFSRAFLVSLNFE